MILQKIRLPLVNLAVYLGIDTGYQLSSSSSLIDRWLEGFFGKV